MQLSSYLLLWKINKNSGNEEVFYPVAKNDYFNHYNCNICNSVSLDIYYCQIRIKKIILNNSKIFVFFYTFLFIIKIIWDLNYPGQKSWKEDVCKSRLVTLSSNIQFMLLLVLFFTIRFTIPAVQHIKKIYIFIWNIFL